MSLLLFSSFARGESLEQWTESQKIISKVQILANISPPDALPGTVIASPHRDFKPDGNDALNYYYHWVRDAALTMNTVLDIRERAPQSEQTFLETLLRDYSKLSRLHQTTTFEHGLGTAKYNVDGSAYSRGWCNPQNDGPALRSITLGRYANLLISQGQREYVTSHLYDGKIPTQSVIKADLEYIAHHWQKVDCDLWEEVHGEHFFTRMVQRKALIQGAALANQLGDFAAATFYLDQAKKIETAIEAFWNSKLGLIVPTLNYQKGPQKPKNIDSSVILGILHGQTRDGFLKYSDPKVLSTFRKHIEEFKKLYTINNRSEFQGVAIGRYPEDVYGGSHFNGANPWFLLTSAFAQICFLASEELRNQGDFVQATELYNQGVSFLARVKTHSANGRMSEQFHRDSGYMDSARDLTWSYTETLEAIWAKERVSKKNK